MLKSLSAFFFSFLFGTNAIFFSIRKRVAKASVQEEMSHVKWADKGSGSATLQDSSV